VEGGVEEKISDAERRCDSMGSVFVDSSRPLKIAIVAGEMSGDLLGSGLMQSLKKYHNNIEFVGIGGPKMIDAGCQSLFPMERLAVMGIVEVLGRLRELLSIRKSLAEEFIQNPPDLFIGIDAPDFTISLELMLREKGIKTAHYVSPSIWAWRQKRVFKIKKAVDLMLTLLPFEAAFYEKYDVPVTFVGHPLANIINVDLDTNIAKKHWGYNPSDKIIAVLPGSRGGELKHIGPLFIEVMNQCFQIDPRIKFVVPVANAARRAQFERQLSLCETDLPVLLVDGHAREVMAGADAVLVASGTATLEAMLLKRPMVVAYKWGAITHAIISPLVKSRYISLPNLLADEELIPEFVQSQATPEKIVPALMTQLNDVANREKLTQRFNDIHHQLRQNASDEAALALMKLLEYKLD